MEKLVITPKVIPTAFLCPPVAEEDKIIGRIGQIQGAKIVKSPEIKANKSKSIMPSILSIASAGDQELTISPYLIPLKLLCPDHYNL